VAIITKTTPRTVQATNKRLLSSIVSAHVSSKVGVMKRVSEWVNQRVQVSRGTIKAKGLARFAGAPYCTKTLTQIQT